jgi:hypothetical protein
MAASPGELIVAIFNGAPTPEAAARYSAQITAMISLYIVFVAVFLVGLYIRRTGQRGNLSPARRGFRVWIAFALLASLLIVSANLLLFCASID